MSPRNRPRRPKSPLGFMPVLKCTFFLGRPVQLAHFRGALVEHIGRSRPLLESLGLDGALFHGRDDNHPDWVDAGGRAIDHQKKVPVLNWPPVVYYRTDGQHPVVVGVGPGARALQLLLLSFARELQVEGRNVSILGWNGERFNCPMGPADDAEYLLEEYAFLKEAKDLEAYEAPASAGCWRASSSTTSLTSTPPWARTPVPEYPSPCWRRCVRASAQASMALTNARCTRSGSARTCTCRSKLAWAWAPAKASAASC